MYIISTPTSEIRLMNTSLRHEGMALSLLPRNIYWELLCSSFPGKHSLKYTRGILKWQHPIKNITPYSFTAPSTIIIL
jgi:hypothetical protein